MSTGDVSLALLCSACLWLGAAALLPLLVRQRALGTLAATLGPLVGGGLALVAGLVTLLRGATAETTLFSVLPGRDVALAATPLGAFFWLVIALPALALGLFAAGALRAPRRTDVAWSTAVLTNALLLVLLLLVTVADALSFLFLWELLSVTAFLLVMYGNDGEGTGSWAALGVLQAGGACLLIAFVMLNNSCNSLRFSTLLACAPQLDGRQQSVLFLLVLAACTAGMGVVPLQWQLPRSRPAEQAAALGGLPLPALVPALAGRVAVYPLLLVPFTFLGQNPLWWGAIVLALGALSALLAALRALYMRSLGGLAGCYGTIGSGTVLMGLGAALLARAGGAPAPATALGLSAALFSMLSAAAGATLLYMVADAAQSATGSSSIERMGGLFRGMLWTGTCFLAGAFLAPLGGFVAGWLTVQSLLAIATELSSPGYGGLALLGAAALTLAAALGAAAAVLAFGVGFLGPPRTEEARMAREVSPLQRVAMALLTVAGVGYGVAPGGVAALMRPVVAALAGPLPTSSVTFDWWTALRLSPTSRSMVPVHTALLPLGILACLVGAAAFLALGAGAHTHASRRPGEIAANRTMALPVLPVRGYTIAAFAGPIRRMVTGEMRAALRAIEWPRMVMRALALRQVVGRVAVRVMRTGGRGDAHDVRAPIAWMLGFALLLLALAR